MKKVIITGATGAIGIALVKKLLEEDIRMLVIVHRGSPRVNNLPKNSRIQIVEANLEEYHTLQLLEKDWDVFYHLAWGGTVGDARNDMYRQNGNIRYTLDAVHLAHRSGCKTFIGVGSQAEYGRHEGVLRADTPVHPDNGYGMAKLCAGQMSRALCHDLGIKHVWTRVLSVYGPYDGENTMIIAGIRKLLQGEKPVFSPAEQMWDYLFSEDAAKALYLIAEKGLDGAVYPIGSGKAKKLREYIISMKAGVEKQTEKVTEVGIGELPYRENQVMHLCADITDLKRDTGFQPEISFDKGIAKTIEWCKDTAR